MVKALAHPLRIQILDALEGRTASPREMAEQIGAPLGNVSYHVRRLEALGVLKLVEETPRRGVVEHFYRIDKRPNIQGDAWQDAPGVVKESFLGSSLAGIAARVNAAARSGGFDRADARVSRLPLSLDEQGFAEAEEATRKLEESLEEIQERSRRRAKGNQDKGQIDAVAVLMLFEGGPSD